MRDDETTARSVHRAAVAVGAAQLLLLAGAAAVHMVGPVGLAAGLVFGGVVDVLVVLGLRRADARRIGPANAVTWMRAALVGVVLGSVVGGSGTAPAVIAVGAVALALDGVDGRIARATGTATPFGARFDMEVDAALIAVLSVAATPIVSPWILLVGAARYLLLGATLLIPWLGAPTSPRMWRKAVAVAQGVVLLVVCAVVLPPTAAWMLALASATALGVSFGTQIAGLARRRRAERAPVPVQATAPRTRRHASAVLPGR